MTKFLLFSGEHCKNCKPMKENMLKAGIEFEVMSVDEPNGARLASTYLIKTLPMLIITENGNPKKSYPGLLTVAKLIEIKNKYAH
jgi:hypothetical protein